MKKLELVFSTAGKTQMTLTVNEPKEGLTLTEVKQAADKLVPVLVTRTGAEVTGFIKALIVSTTEEELH